MKCIGNLKNLGRLLIFLAAVGGLFSSPPGAKAEGEENVTAAAENGISFETAPVKVISTSPAITEILFYIGAGERVKGVTALCDFPEEARGIEKIGDLNLNYEKVLEIRPDVVFLMKGLRAKEFEVLNSFGARPVELDLSSMENIFNSIDRAAEILKAPKNSSELRKRMKTIAALINKKQKNIMRSVYFEIWGDPPMTIGGSSFINEIITGAHGMNIFNESNIENLSVSLEKVIENNPEFIVAAYNIKTSEIALRPGFSNIIAVKDANVIKVDYNIYVRPGPRAVDAVLDLYNRLYPDAPVTPEEIAGD